MEARPEPMRFRDLTAAIEVTHNEQRKFLIEALDDALAEAVQKAAKYQSKSVFAVKVEVQVTGDKVSLSADLVSKLPSPSPTAIGAYVDKAGRLMAEDPRQESLPFQIAPKQEGAPE